MGQCRASVFRWTKVEWVPDHSYRVAETSKPQVKRTGNCISPHTFATRSTLCVCEWRPALSPSLRVLSHRSAHKWDEDIELLSPGGYCVLCIFPSHNPVHALVSMTHTGRHTLFGIQESRRRRKVLFFRSDSFLFDLHFREGQIWIKMIMAISLTLL